MYKVLSAPLVAQIEISARCPNRCLTCYNYWRKGNVPLAHLNLSREGAKRVVDELRAHRVFHVVLTGGEPLMNKRVLFWFAETALASGMTVGINSTLISLTLSDAQRIKELGVGVVLTSLMGPTAEVHNSIAQRHNAFERTVRGIRLLRELQVPVVVNMVVSQRNKGLVRETAKFVKSLGLKQFSSTRAGCPGNCPDFSDFSLSIADFRAYLRELHDVGIEQQMNVGVLGSYPLCAIKEVREFKAFTGRRCLAGVTTLTVAVDGSVRPCSHLDMSYGNIFSDDLSSIWQKMSRWRDGSLLPNHCKSCEALRWCGGGCRMEAKMRNHSLSAPDPYCVPEDSDYVVGELSRAQEIGANPFTFPQALSINPRARWRKESFGGVVFVGPRFAAYLNDDAMNFLKSIEKGHSYAIPPDLSSDSPGRRGFIENLLKREVLVPSSNGAL